MLKVAFSGAQGVGKTTILKGVKEKLENDGYRITILPELIRQCPYPADAESTFSTQLWVSSQTILHETELIKDTDILLVDRPITDIAVYKELVKQNKGMTRQEDEILTHLIDNWKTSYHLFFAITVPIDVWKTRDLDDGFRSTDPELYKFLADRFYGVAPEHAYFIENIDVKECINTVYEKITADSYVKKS
ncbi:MAG: AAA family ATPase [candidate division Zixibacteria bacterium]|nr:AAA family ATPase [candidate division Zixibacteria bacterium]